MKFYIQVGFFAIFMSLVSPTVVLADGFEACVFKAASHSLDSKRKFQISVRNLIIRTRPKFKILADISAQLQIALAEKRFAKLVYLTKFDPKRIVTHHGISKFSNFEWSRRDETAFIARDGKYKALSEQTITLEAKSQGHLDWSELRKYFRSGLTQTPGYKNAIKTFSDRQQELKMLISKCSHK